MARYEMFQDEENQQFAFHLHLPYGEVAEYIGEYGNVYADDDAMGDEFSVARKAVAYGAFRSLAENCLHEELKHFCQGEIDWSAIHPDDDLLASPYEGAPTPQELLDDLLLRLGLLAD